MNWGGGSDKNKDREKKGNSKKVLFLGKKRVTKKETKEGLKSMF